VFGPLPAPRDESGQVVVEAAIVLPLALLALLGLLQLALVQEARLLLEYAAHRAARAGALWNADPERMARAARPILGAIVCPSRWSALPCPPKDQPLLRAAAGAAALRAVAATGGFPGLEVEEVDPPRLPAGLRELDFDRTDLDADGRAALLLTVRLRYWLELKIPFADAAIWHAWHAVGARRLPLARRIAVEAAAASGHYFVPLETTHTARMQSNRFTPEVAP